MLNASDRIASCAFEHCVLSGFNVCLLDIVRATTPSVTAAGQLTTERAGQPRYAVDTARSAALVRHDRVMPPRQTAHGESPFPRWALGGCH